MHTSLSLNRINTLGTTLIPRITKRSILISEFKFDFT